VGVQHWKIKMEVAVIVGIYLWLSALVIKTITGFII